MNPDVARAIPRLQERGLLAEEQARYFLRAATSDLLSVRSELKLLLYAGVVLITAGVGVLITENVDRLGPGVIAVGLGVAAALSFLWVARHAPPFSWGESVSTHVAFDYVLLLGVLLSSADLAYVEAQFTPLGPNWPWHLLVASLFTGALALRFDSRLVFSLALSTFTAWRGVSVSFVERGFWSGLATATLLNAIGCGLLFVLLGALLFHEKRKEHFEPVATYLGVVLVLVALASGSIMDESSYRIYAASLIVAGAILAAGSLVSRRRFPLFALGTFAIYFGLSRLVLPAIDDDTLVLLWFLITAGLSIAAVMAVHRSLERSP
jgi:hypothetical protein